ncbi:MAG: hypothetical protein Q6352_009555 [Candidatus Freyrarchaeum guaymaensis]|nr:hypothetical protein [Candidatus Sigynarchaeota archaeon]
MKGDLWGLLSGNQGLKREIDKPPTNPKKYTLTTSCRPFLKQGIQTSLYNIVNFKILRNESYLVSPATEDEKTRFAQLDESNTLCAR